MIPLSEAMAESGAAQKLAGLLVDVVGDTGPYPLLIGVFVLTAAVTQLMSNTATALLVITIATFAAGSLDVSVRPVLMTLNIAAAATFLTPVGTPANLMVMEPAGYRFGDYVRLGVPLPAWYFLVAVLLVPVFWPA